MVALTAAEKDLGDLAPAIIGQKIGSRTAYLKTSPEQNTAEIVVVDLLPTKIAGVHIQPRGWPGNPIVNNSSELLPQIVTRGEPPAIVKTHNLISGKGDQIADGNSVYANYLLIDYDGNIVENTYLEKSRLLSIRKKFFPGCGRELLISGLVRVC
ncbi:hypothetical protein RQN30_01410 [Arcanobacterium hippocoleae]